MELEELKIKVEYVMGYKMRYASRPKKKQVRIKKVFIALAMRKTDTKQKELADFMGYKNHTSIQAHLIMPSTRVWLEDYIKEDYQLNKVFNQLMKRL